MISNPDPTSPKSSVADPDLGSGIRCFFDLWIRDPDPGSEMKKNPDPETGSGVNIIDHFSESLETVFWVKHTLML
jgi:hypothetical protein